MNKYLSLIIIIFISSSTFSQKLINFLPEQDILENRKFYVSKIIDIREHKTSIGVYTNDSSDLTENIDIKGGVLKATGDYFQINFTKKTDEQVPVIIKIKKVLVKQDTTDNKQKGTAFTSLIFEQENKEPLEINSEISEITENAFISHEKRIRQAFKDCARKFNNTIEDVNVYNIISEEDEEAIEINFDTEEKPKKKYDNSNKVYHKKELENVTTVGYQIGGGNLLGIDYERRISKHFGMHVGAGIFGYTIGAKFHVNEKQNSLFLNLSWKDSGLGLINGFGVEAGSRWIWSKRRNFGLLYQGGILIINHMDSDYEDDVFDGNAPPVLLFIGVGLSW